MTSRAIARLRGFLFLLAAAAACSGGTEPPPPPPGAPIVTAPSAASLPVGMTYDLSATFTDTSSNAAPWSYDVDWGDGNRSTGSKSAITPIETSHAYATQGNYTVTVAVTNSKDATGTASATVAATAPVIITAGDIGDCGQTSDDATGALLDDLAGIVMPLGDLAYLNGTPTEFANCYGGAWGRVKSRTRPVPGNHDYYTPGAAGYFGYFGAAAGDPAKGYYDFVLGDWLVIVINTGTEHPTDYEPGSPQEQWLRAELASHTQPCVLALWHHPRFSTVTGRDLIRPEVTGLWNALYEYGADLILNGHDHNYQRWAPQKPDGTADAAFGIRQITVGTGGGESLYGFAPIPAGANIEVRNNTTVGVLKLTLRSGGYDWAFLPAAGGTFTDSGSATCHGRPS
ncbi:MAG TPA: PKD domain-containing protein [Gemmatimonadales bacterium]|nr:PKD domain-containing protein [Gemmatimonadales bacterium]